MNNVKCEMKTVHDVSMFSIYGDITFENFGQLRKNVASSIGSLRSPKVLVSLNSPRNIDSVTIGTIVSIYKTVRLRNGSFGVIVPTEASKEIFFTTGLNRLFPIFESEDLALISV